MCYHGQIQLLIPGKFGLWTSMGVAILEILVSVLHYIFSTVSDELGQDVFAMTWFNLADQFVAVSYYFISMTLYSDPKPCRNN